MNYYILADLAVFGLFLIGLGVTILIMDRRITSVSNGKKGADKSGKHRIRAHQNRRARYMLGNGGLPVEMERNHGH